MKTLRRIMILCVGGLLLAGMLYAHEERAVPARARHAHAEKYALPLGDAPEILLLKAQHEAEMANHVNQEAAVGRAAQLRYQGTRAAANPKATGAEAALQKRIADEFAETDLVPAERIKYFDWCLTHPFVVHIGWYVSIDSMTGNQVVVSVSPWFMGTQTATACVFDYCLETWDFSKDTLTFVKLEPGVDAKPGIIAGD